MKNMRTWVGIAGIIVFVVFLMWVFSSPLTEGPTATSTPTQSSTVVHTTKKKATPIVGQSQALVPIAEASSVAGVVAGISSASEFASLFSSSGVAAQVSGKGPYTIFVPSDAAFARLAKGTISNLTATQLKRLVQYHIIVGRAIDADAISSGSVDALSKDPINFSVQADKSVRINSSLILKTYQGKNGVVYLIDGVLLPPLKAY